MICRLIEDTLPSFQNVEHLTLNLGFGHVLYGLVRTLRPKNVVTIGSKAGFTPVILGLGVKDNEGFGVGTISCYNTTSSVSHTLGQVHFVDPSYSIDRGDDNHWYGIGFWDNKQKVHDLWLSYGVENIVQHYLMTSEMFALSPDCPSAIDLLYIDGDHSYEGMTRDFELYYPKLKRNALIIAHDVDPQISALIAGAGGFEVFCDLSLEKYEKLRLPVFPGLALLRKR